MSKRNLSGDSAAASHHIIDVTIQSPGHITVVRGPRLVSISGAIGNIPWARVMPVVEGLVDIVAEAADVPRDVIRVAQELVAAEGSTEMVATYAISLDADIAESVLDEIRSCAEIYVRRLKAGESASPEEIIVGLQLSATAVDRSVMAADKARLASKSAALPAALDIAVAGRSVTVLSGRLAPMAKSRTEPEDEVIHGTYDGFRHSSRELYVIRATGESLTIAYDEAKFAAQISGLGSSWPCRVRLDVSTEISGNKSKRTLTDITIVTMHPRADPPDEDPNT